MATIVLSAAGMALGSSVGGSVLGLSAATIGRAVGATVGRRIDERILGAGSAPVETGRVDRFRLTGASEGAPVSQVYGRMRVAGQVIWATKFLEGAETTGGGKGAAPQPQTTTYSYSVSLAIALCRGPITRVGRVWADGVEISPASLGMSVYKGGDDQLPDPKMEAVEGAGRVPAYRGMAYVVLEDLQLGQFGNRVPQLSFEVFAPSAKRGPVEGEDIAGLVQAVALIPGSGEYALATTPVYLSRNYGEQEAVNLNSPSGKTDFAASLDALGDELPECGSVSLVVSWFGDDLRAGECTIRPKVEQQEVDAEAMPWRVSGVTRAAAPLVPRVGDRPIYGGAHTDASVIEAITALRAAGQDVVFYPFILMDQLDDNALPNPYTGTAGQPALPWRGRITTALAPGMTGTTDGTAAAEAEVAAFFGTATAGDFATNGQTVDYTGPEDWGFRRFVLHQAHLCALAGGVTAFCIGTEMVALTQIRGAGNSFPAVAALRTLAADVRGILGAATKIGYAADWSEYHGYQPAGTADKLFHLDPLWADANIDFIGIDNYMPLSDWRDGTDHLDAAAGAIYDIDYLTANVAGGEGYDWFYATDENRDLQIRTPITDGAQSEPWVYRYKDIRNWWTNPHYDRIGGVRQGTPTAWKPQSKPIWFTEAGCAAIDKGTNQPNKFLDPKSSESQLPYYSSGRRDDYIQIQYLSALSRHWADPAENPTSEVYGGRMIDISRTHIWTWDARPFPAFPGNTALWSDGANYARGHWLTGRTANRPLSSVIAEVCARAGVTKVDTSALYGILRGYRVDDTDTARAVLQPLMMAYGFDAIERDGTLVFRTRDGRSDGTYAPDRLVLDPGRDATYQVTRASEPEVAGRVRVTFIEGEGDYEVRAVEAAFPDERQSTITQSELALALTRPEGQRVAERWLAEARLARETARFALPPSADAFGAGDVIDLGDGPKGGLWRIDSLETTEHRSVDAVRVDPEVYLPQSASEEAPLPRSYVPPVPVAATFLDLPLLRGDEVPHAPYVAVTAQPWPGAVALYASEADEDYTLDRFLPRPSVVGTTLTPLNAACAGLWDRGPALRVRLVRGALSSLPPARVLSGGNAMAIGDGAAQPWEVFQFTTATLVGAGVYDLSWRLRGQAGTNGIAPDIWPAGSRVVLLNGTPEQIDLSISQRNLPRYFRYGPARRAPDDISYLGRTETFTGVGLRPYSVAHLRAVRTPGGITARWIRRTRIDGDSWDGAEVPLNEAVEEYVLVARAGGITVRIETLTSPAWSYTNAMQAADGATGQAVSIEVAQVSDSFGPGPVRSVVVA